MNKQICWVGHKLGRGVNSVAPKTDSHLTFRIRIINEKQGSTAREIKNWALNITTECIKKKKKTEMERST